MCRCSSCQLISRSSAIVRSPNRYRQRPAGALSTWSAGGQPSDFAYGISQSPRISSGKFGSQAFRSSTSIPFICSCALAPKATWIPVSSVKPTSAQIWEARFVRQHLAMTCEGNLVATRIRWSTARPLRTTKEHLLAVTLAVTVWWRYHIDVCIQGLVFAMWLLVGPP